MQTISRLPFTFLMVALGSLSTGAQEPTRLWNFDAVAEGELPSRWSIRETHPTVSLARWNVRPDSQAPSPPNVLTLGHTENEDATFNLAVAEDTSFEDLDLSVRIRPESGSIDQGGGPVWRCRDENNYYIARFNPLESNFRVYVVSNGRRHQLDSARVETRPGTWYTVRVTMVGRHIACYLDGKKYLEVEDGTFTQPGMVGLWTKADAASSFDDLNVRDLGTDSAPILAPRSTVQLPGVEGRIDHLALDGRGQLFVAALENGSLEVIDLRRGAATRRVTGLAEPQGILCLPRPSGVAVVLSCGGDGTVRLFDAGSLEETARVDVGDDADNLRFEPRRGAVWVACGDGALAGLGSADLASIASVPLSAHPESFQIEPGGATAYVNVPDSGRIEVVDLEKGSVTTSWKIEGAAANYPMALDAEGHRLFVACRRPGRLLVFDTRSGEQSASVPCVGDADDLFLDPITGTVLVVGGEGFVDVFAARDLTRLARMPTAAGARTGLFDPVQRMLYVAVPARSGHPAEIQVFEFSG
ncbi:MAG TPA: hypothetical protein ENJ09_00020 [Planctomycetes bacterium]|nr:hypothetical protein [Planctomycetota bacterium]